MRARMDDAAAEAPRCPACPPAARGGCGKLSQRCRPDAEYVIARLEEAGRTLLAMRGAGAWPAGYGSSWPPMVREAVKSYGWQQAAPLVPVPDPAAIDRMDAAWPWLGLVPDSKGVMRRIVAARSMVHPAHGRHLFPWRKLARAVGADHKAVQRWHGQGVALIVGALDAPLGKES